MIVSRESSEIHLWKLAFWTQRHEDFLVQICSDHFPEIISGLVFQVNELFLTFRLGCTDWHHFLGIPVMFAEGSSRLESKPNLLANHRTEECYAFNELRKIIFLDITHFDGTLKLALEKITHWVIFNANIKGWRTMYCKYINVGAQLFVVCQFTVWKGQCCRVSYINDFKAAKAYQSPAARKIRS